MSNTFSEQSHFKRFSIPLKILASLLMLSWLFSTMEWQQITQILLRMNGGWMAMALGWVVISVGVSAYKWQLILKALQLHVPLSVLWKNYWAGLFFNNFLPSSMGGDGLRIYWVGQVTEDMAGSTTSVVVERVLATIGLCLTAILAILLSQVKTPHLIAFFGAVMLVGTLILSLLLFPHVTGWLQKRLGFLPRVQSFLLGISSHGMRLRNQPRLMFYALIGSVFFQMCVVMVNWCLFKAISVNDLNLIEAAAVIPATSVAAMLPIGINGYGVREGAYIALFAPLGISSSIALTVSILFALLVSFASLWGGWIWIKEGRRDVGKKEFLTTIERQADHYFSEGYNCCQSILLAANDIWELHLDQATIAAGRFFQHGMGCGSTCGALIGAQMALGILDQRYETKFSNQYARKLSEEFNQTFGTTQCSELRKKQSIMDKIGYKGCKRITYMTAGVFYEFWESANGNPTSCFGHYSDVK